MSWVKLDDAMLDHPKIADLDPLATLLDIAGILYCSRNLTDGFIPRKVAMRLVDFSGYPGGAKRRLSALVSVGRWEVDERGYRVHDYLTYNPSKAKVLANRKIRAQTGQTGGHRSVEVRLDRYGSAEPLVNHEGGDEGNSEGGDEATNKATGEANCFATTEANAKQATNPVNPVPESLYTQSVKPPTVAARAHEGGDDPLGFPVEFTRATALPPTEAEVRSGGGCPYLAEYLAVYDEFHPGVKLGPSGAALTQGLVAESRRLVAAGEDHADVLAGIRLAAEDGQTGAPQLVRLIQKAKTAGTRRTTPNGQTWAGKRLGETLATRDMWGSFAARPTIVDQEVRS